MRIRENLTEKRGRPTVVTRRQASNAIRSPDPAREITCFRTQPSSAQDGGQKRPLTVESARSIRSSGLVDTDEPAKPAQLGRRNGSASGAGWGGLM